MAGDEQTGRGLLGALRFGRIVGREGARVNPSLSGSLRRLRDNGVLALFVILFIALSILSDVFLSRQNLLNILEQQAAIGIIAAGSTLVLVGGGIDLSVGATFAIGGVIAARLAGSFDPMVAFACALAVGTVIGVANGLITTVGRINSLIGTLATGIIIKGFALILSQGLFLSVADPAFTTLGRATALSVKYAIWIFAGFALITGLVLARTTFGRYLYAAGGNAEAARLSGVRVDLVRTLSFGLSGFGAALAGVIVASRVGAGQAEGSAGIELSVIAAMVVGGTSIMGGEGAVWRSILGVLLLALIGNGFNLLQVSPEYQRIIQGSILILAVGVDAWSRRSR